MFGSIYSDGRVAAAIGALVFASLSFAAALFPVL
jgi:hypothetical protein